MTDIQHYKKLNDICNAYDIDIVKAEGVSDRYSCIVFTQAYNERHHVKEFLENISHFSEKVVIFDDGSTDGTGEEFQSDQVLIHLRRQENSGFNDYINRSLLIELGKLIDTKWMLFLDMDERIDPSYSNSFKFLLNFKLVEHIRFRYVHLWDKRSSYRTDYPHSNEGVQYRLKMIRRKDRMEIPKEKLLHFEMQPYNTEREIKSNVLILHLGSLLPENRKRRYELYKSLDPNNLYQSSYEHLISQNAKTKNIANLKKSTFKVILNDLRSYLQIVFNSISKTVLSCKRSV